MTCEQTRDELVAYAKGDLNEDRREAIEEHLARCAGCRSELDSVSRVLAMTEAAEEEPVVRIANNLFQDAIRQSASDIHIEPTTQPEGGKETLVRFRVDGVLREHARMPSSLHEPLINRIKLMAEMSLQEKRVTQDGRIAVRFGGKPYDLRCSVIPFFHGEGCVIRILDPSSVLIGLDKLGFSPEMETRLERLIRQPQGMLLLTGPTGSGKTTTLYSILHRLNRPEVKMVTVEDPVEYLLRGVNQVQVNRNAGMTFAASLRSFLRHDPDIMMIGEMRDLATAELATEAALTGHLVLSCLHTRDSTEAVTRLKDIGVEPFLIGSVLIGVVAARLIRRVCSHCKEPYSPAEEVLESFGFTESNRPPVFYHGAGCDQCSATGYRGRTGLFELLVVEETLKQAVSDGKSEAEIRAMALEKGMLIPFSADARLKVAEGVTTLEEVARVLEGVPSARR